MITRLFREDWFKTVDSGVDVIVNPSMHEIKKEFENWAFAGVRAILTLDGKKLYCWNADEMLHQDMISYLQLNKRNIVTIHLLIGIKTILVTSTTSLVFSKEQKEEYEEIIRNSKQIYNAMGSDFEVIF